MPPVPSFSLSRRALNRATLARQLLLERAAVSVPDAVSQVGGLQAQVVSPPYIGLWTRLIDFRREDLTEQILQKQVVRATYLRSTLHLITAEDYCRLRPILQPALVRALNGFHGLRIQGLDTGATIAAARAYLEKEPRTFAQIKTLLLQRDATRDGDAMCYVVRTHLPLVQIPTGGTWGYPGNPSYALAESYLGRPIASDTGPRDLIRRYLAAFGPANGKDIQVWAGMTGLRETLTAMRDELVVYRDDQGKELFDLPEMPMPDLDTSAPIRFLPEYDNLLLAHADRTRVIADEHRPRVFLSAARVRATFLVDGFVCGAWKIEREQGRATLVVEPFTELTKAIRDTLIEEGENLLRFIEEGATSMTIRFA
jgi:hypothetical protein